VANDRWRCDDYLRWVASLPCARCAREDTVQAHHFKGTGHMSGVGLKAPDYWAMPLCSSCHTELHRSMTRREYAQQYEWSARTLAAFMQLMADGLGDHTMRMLVRGVARSDVIGGRSL
jgi:hypothetical protein